MEPARILVVVEEARSSRELGLTIFDQPGRRLLRVEVTDIRESTYYAVLHLESAGKPIAIDCRPSDAIAIAIRMEVPIVVRDTVIDKALRADATSGGSGEKDKWTELLERMNPEDFSKYKM